MPAGGKVLTFGGKVLRVGELSTLSTFQTHPNTSNVKVLIFFYYLRTFSRCSTLPPWVEVSTFPG
jgi:hypothetical protein